MARQLNPKDLVRTDKEYRYATHGIPPRFWHVDLRKLAFRQCRFGVSKTADKLPPNAQRRALTQCYLEPTGQLICIGSAPTDEGALAAASWVLCNLLDTDHTIGVLNAQFVRNKLPRGTNAFMIHNVLNDATNERVEAIRDRLVSWERPVRILVVAGCTDPYTFCVERVGLLPDYCCYVKEPQA